MKAFHTKIVGSTFCGGQKKMRNLKKDDVLKLIRDPQNKFDPNAVGVHLLEGTRIGYIPKELAVELAKVMDAGIEVSTIVTGRTGGGPRMNVGCNLEIYHE